MAICFAEKALLPEGWAHNVRIAISDSGYITEVKCNSQAAPADLRLRGPVVPGMPNLHSHAFQRAMAGLTEVAGNAADSFWSWRDLMYQVVGKLTPAQMHTIASYVYIEMLKAGYTSVAEFHYLHHDPQGKPWQQRGESGLHISDAAAQTGIGLTLLPVLYSYGGFGQQPPSPSQARFINTTDDYLALYDDLRSALNSQPDQQIGLCFHSLRAVTADQMRQVLNAFPGQQPVHIHIAEQQKEVDDCLAWSGQRPVEWLYHHLPVDARWCLIHATHLSRQELSSMAQSGAVAGLCPTTEANLGDGLFSGTDYLACLGHWGIGSDSHISVSVAEELRLFEYGQRLRDQQRNRLNRPSSPHTGTVLYTDALEGGRRALGLPVGGIAVGARADLLVLDHQDPFIATASDDAVLNRWIFACAGNPVRDVMSGGKWVIKAGHHAAEEQTTAAFSQVLHQLFT